MSLGSYVACFFGAMFFVNAIPHSVSGWMGRSFQSPFAKPPGEGHSSSTSNVWWGAFNFALAYVLLVRVADFDLHNGKQVLVAGCASLVMGLYLARRFGRFNGGNDPKPAGE